MSGGKSAVIVGAGIGGLTAALSLARDGWQVQVFEQAHRLEPVGSGLQISPNASRVLADLGVLPRLDGLAVEPEAMVVRSGRNGSTLTSMPLGETAEKRWGAPFLVVHRGDLQNALLAAATEQSSIALHLGRRLEALKFRDRSVTATLSRYTDELTVETDLLIGADGLWSKVRGQVGLTGPASFSGCVAWRTLIPADSVPAFAREMRSNLWLGSGAHVVHYPLRGGSVINVVAVVEENWRERGWSEPGDIAWINRRFEDWHSDLTALIGSADTWLRWSLFDRAPEWRWSRSPAVLLGDAAHPMLPFLAQGAAQAIEDAAVLSRSLRGHASISDALKGYEEERLRRAARIQRLSHRQASIYHLANPAAIVRDAAMALLGHDVLARRYGWIYDHRA
ncbi:MAG TPA: FAD-dependent monooxygenase [Beijerinckiaceae bacterium]|nr:FAD-dependent monooxygenase [Beijerinckiaceae bacterium]